MMASMPLRTLVSFTATPETDPDTFIFELIAQVEIRPN